MTLVSLERIERRFGDVEVLSGASLRVDEGERIGIIGDNGSGKTTLIRILAGVDEADRGLRNTRRELRISYAEQVPRLDAGTTVRDWVLRGDGSFDALEARIRALEHDLATHPGDERILAEYGDLQVRFEAGGGLDRTHVCERVMTGLGFDESSWQKDVSVLSGGERSRVVLSALMTMPADLLILDEPTNHLDLEGIEFVEDYVTRFPGAVVVISHDRRFLDAVATRIVEVEDGETSSYKGNYTAFRRQKELQLLSEARAYEKQQAFVEKEMDYIRRNMAGRMSRQAKGRLKRLTRVQILSRPKRGKRAMRVAFGEEVRGQVGQTMIEAFGVTLEIGGRKLLDRADFKVLFGEVVALVGRNGAGKSTLLRAIAGHRAPDAGRFERARGLRIASFSQEVTDLPHGITVLAALRQVDPDAEDRELRDHLGLFMFSGDDGELLVDGLSGGEKQRLALARMTRAQYDLLLLDEPTNHLDVAGCESLERSIAEFPGTIVLVTHDRELLASAASRVLWLTDRKVRSLDGGLDAWSTAVAEQRARDKEAQAKAKAASAQPVDAKAAIARNDRVRNPMMFERLEAQIMELESELESVRGAMVLEDNYRSADKLMKLQAREKEIQASLVEAYQRWENWN
ncbi:MAG: ABC-F family ATP-binding cassette domain-containing protein [Planctomycetota bacterium]